MLIKSASASGSIAVVIEALLENNANQWGCGLWQMTA
jgi:hypothetical protein